MAEVDARQPTGRFARTLTALSDNTYLSAIRAGMVSVVPLTIIGGLFMIAAHLPVSGWDAFIAPYRHLLQMPVAATFGLLGLVACFSIAYDLGRRLGQDAMTSASMATVAFLLIQLDPNTETLVMDNLGSKGLFTAILVALVSVHAQKFFTDRDLVIKLPASVPPIVSQSFVSLNPLVFLVVFFWLVRFVAGIDITQMVQSAFAPLVFALNTLPGILVYASLVTVLWSVGINGDNAVDAIVAPIFLQFLAENVAAMTDGRPLPYVTAYGFFTTFVNVGGTGATIALALLLLNSRQSRVPEGQPTVAPDSGVPDQRTNLLRPADRLESGVHDSLYPQRIDSDDCQLSAHLLGCDSQTVRQCSLDHAADHRALSGDRRRLEGCRLGRDISRDCDAGVLPVCQSGRTALSACGPSERRALRRCSRGRARALRKA